MHHILHDTSRRLTAVGIVTMESPQPTLRLGTWKPQYEEVHFLLVLMWSRFKQRSATLGKDWSETKGIVDFCM